MRSSPVPADERRCWLHGRPRHNTVKRAVMTRWPAVHTDRCPYVQSRMDQENPAWRQRAAGPRTETAMQETTGCSVSGSPQYLGEHLASPGHFLTIPDVPYHHGDVTYTELQPALTPSSWPAGGKSYALGSAPQSATSMVLQHHDSNHQTPAEGVPRKEEAMEDSLPHEESYEAGASARGRQSEVELLSVKRGKDGVIQIQKAEDLSLGKGEEKMLKKMVTKGATSRPVKSDKDIAYGSLDKEIHKYLVRYEAPEATRKITMKELRHIIPLLIMRCYNISDEPYQRKVRGMWAEKPGTWPSDIPYCDPNNKKDQGKPKKDVLMSMFQHLSTFYGQLHWDVLTTYKHTMSSGGHVGYVEPMEAVPKQTAAVPMTPATANQPAVPAFLPQCLTSTVVTEATATTTSAAQGSPPSPTVISPPSVESFVWHPEQDILERIGTKLSHLNSSPNLTVSEKGLLLVNKDLIGKMYQVRIEDPCFYLETAHEFECTLDILQSTGRLSDKCRTKWQGFQDKWYLEIVSLANVASECGDGGQ